MNSCLEPNISEDNVNGLPGEVQHVLLPVAGFWLFVRPTSLFTVKPGRQGFGKVWSIYLVG